MIAAPLCGVALGITTVGPVAGGLFSTLQGLGLVTTGGILATVQSAVMGGTGLAAVSVAGAGAGAVVVGGATTAVVAVIPGEN